MKGKSLIEMLSYGYIKGIKRWMECPLCHKRMLFCKEKKSWVCIDCNYSITEADFLDDFVFWFCDGCNAYLNAQLGFDRKGSHWVCSQCGFDNDITSENLCGQCKDCGVVLKNPDAAICPECKIIRLQKTKVLLDATSEVCFALSDVTRSEGNTSEIYPHANNKEHDDEKEGTEMKCANCGNADMSSLWDEGDTIYCSICHHRTSVATGEDDVVECPYCHRMRDRKAMYCRQCNDSTWQPSTSEEFEEVDRILKGYGR